jgi:uncharacterized protein YecE (DUF72 family)
MAARVFVGTSGYVYPHWRRRFYPDRVPAREWLPFYARSFESVELNNPFYRLPAAETFAAWRRAAPPGFVFAVKASRYLTHMKKLKDPAAPLALLLGRARRLGPALGPVLFQLPGGFHANVPRLERFLAALARQRRVPGLRAVLEVRHPSWLDAEITGRLEKARVALCLADWRDLPVAGPLTADFVYVRRHGTRRGPYSDAQLRADARAIRSWVGEGRDVYVYFNNDARGYAVRNARRLREWLP